MSPAGLLDSQLDISGERLLVPVLDHAVGLSFPKRLLEHVDSKLMGAQR